VNTWPTRRPCSSRARRWAFPGRAEKKSAALAEGSKLTSKWHRGGRAHAVSATGVGYFGPVRHPPATAKAHPSFSIRISIPGEFADIARAPLGRSRCSRPTRKVHRFQLPAWPRRLRCRNVLPPRRRSATGSGRACRWPTRKIALTPKRVIQQVAHPGTDDYRMAAAIHTTISERLARLLPTWPSARTQVHLRADAG